MKTYDKRNMVMGPECPTGLHEIPYGQPDGCTCPWLAIQSDHQIVYYHRHELDVLLREVDAGTFDPADYPRRTGSKFLPTVVSEIVDLILTDPAAAMMRLFARLNYRYATWDAATETLSFGMETPTGGIDWHHASFAGGHITTSRSDTEPAGDDPDILWEHRFETPREPTTFPQGVHFSATARATIREMGTPAGDPEPTT